MNEVIGYVDVRSAEVATTAIAADVAQVHQDMLDADADAQAAAASASAAAGTLANAVKKTGEASQSIAGDIAVAGTLSGGTVTVPTPVNNTDAASKKYVDDVDALKLNITDVNSYAVGLTGPQTVRGVKKHLDDIEMEFPNTVSNGLIMKSTYADVTAGTHQIGQPKISVYDKNGVRLSRLHTVIYSNGTTALVVDLRNSDGTTKSVIIATGDTI